MAHFALQKLKILPSALAEMTDKEKAFIYGSILVRVENEKKEASNSKHIPRKRNRNRRRR